MMMMLDVKDDKEGDDWFNEYDDKAYISSLQAEMMSLIDLKRRNTINAERRRKTFGKQSNYGKEPEPS